ncbi:MAG: response regulator transcription factor [Acidimicrobiia bacterium]|nr:response regulator transcription factor [Acidimicrobiia bacterium]
MIRVLIADDHQLFAETLGLGIDAVPDLWVAGTVGDGQAVLSALADDPDIDVIVLDLEMPLATGLDVLNSGRPLPPCVVVTMHATDDERTRALEAGAAAFLAKSTPLGDLAAAIRAVASGRRLDDAATLRDILDEFRAPTLDPRAESLTARERELLNHLAGGLTSTPELAEALFISEKTVKNHLASIYDKLAVNDRAQAALEAIHLGIVDR